MVTSLSVGGVNISDWKYNHISFAEMLKNCFCSFVLPTQLIEQGSISRASSVEFERSQFNSRVSYLLYQEHLTQSSVLRTGIN